MNQRPHLVPALLSAVLLVGAVGEHSATYFTALRWIVCLSAAVAVWLGSQNRKPAVMALFAVVAVLFNPVVPIYMDRQSWLPVDLVAAALFVYVATLTQPAPSAPAAVAPSRTGPPPQARAASPTPPGAARRATAAPPMVNWASPIQPARVAPAPAEPLPEELLALGIRLWHDSEPPDMVGARAALERAANAGSVEAMSSLGELLWVGIDPPDLRGACAAYERAAERGDTDAMSSVVLLLTLRDGSLADLERARMWAMRAAAKGDTEGLRRVGDLLEETAEAPGSTEARAVYEAAADLGDVSVISRLISNVLAADPPDFETAHKRAEQAAALGDPDGFFIIGAALQGSASSGDRLLAKSAHERAASMGERQSMVSLVRLLMNGEPPDLTGARAWAIRAADAGTVEGFVELGVMLRSEVDPPDKRAAQRAFNRAAELGGGNALISIVQRLVHLDPPDLKGARTWANRSEAAGYTDGLTDIGYRLQSYEEWDDLAGARTIFEGEGNRGDVEAMFRMVGLLVGAVDPPEVKAAHIWAERAAADGYPQPFFSLGLHLETALPPDLAGARSAYERAAGLGDTTAMFRLADLLLNLEPPEVDLARSWTERRVAVKVEEI